MSSASRNRKGGDDAFYADMVRVISEGFIESFEIAAKRNNSIKGRWQELAIGFFLKTAQTMYKEKQLNLVKILLERALLISPNMTDSLVKQNQEFINIFEQHLDYCSMAKATSFK